MLQPFYHALKLFRTVNGRSDSVKANKRVQGETSEVGRGKV